MAEADGYVPTGQVDKRRVTMRKARLDQATGQVVVDEAVDYVRPDFLDAYVAANTPNWDYVEVSDEPDAGPGGYNGATYVPEHLDHPLAGQFFPATEGA